MELNIESYISFYKEDFPILHNYLVIIDCKYMPPNFSASELDKYNPTFKVMEVEKEFDRFKNAFLSDFKESKEKRYALNKFYNHFKWYGHQFEYEDENGIKCYSEFIWSNLVILDGGDFNIIPLNDCIYSNYRDKYRSKDGFQFKSFEYDTKIEEETMNAYRLLMDKLEDFKKSIEIELFETKSNLSKDRTKSKSSNNLNHEIGDKSCQVTTPQKEQTMSGNDSLDINVYKLKFKNDEDFDRVYNLIKELFPGRDVDLRLAINGEAIKKKLLYLGNQNQFAELFRRIKKHKIISNNYTQTTNWLCKYFEFRYKLGEKTEIRPFNRYTIYDILNKGVGDAKKENRICEVEWLPAIPSKKKTRKYRAKKQNLEVDLLT